MTFLDTHPHPDDPGYCGHELHGADGGPCPTCGWVSHPIPTESAPPMPAPPWDAAGTVRLPDLSAPAGATPTA